MRTCKHLFLNQTQHQDVCRTCACLTISRQTNKLKHTHDAQYSQLAEQLHKNNYYASPNFVDG